MKLEEVMRDLFHTLVRFKCGAGPCALPCYGPRLAMKTRSRSLSHAWTSLYAAPLLVATAACGGALEVKAPEPSRAPTPGSVFGGEGCKAVRNPREPRLTAWDPEDRAQINVVRRSGVVAVSYALSGCEVQLEALPNCIATGAYEFTATPFVKQDYLATQQDLFAELPLGAASLSAKLAANQVLRTDYTLVGVAALPADVSFSRHDLRGTECERATHVVARLFLGGFAMATGEEKSLRGEASLFGAAAGGGTRSAFSRLLEDGDPTACEQARRSGKEDPLCSVALRVGLLPLKEQTKCPAGSEWNGQACANVTPVAPPELNACPAGQQFRNGECTATPSFSAGLTETLSGPALNDYRAGNQLFRQNDKARAGAHYRAAYEASRDPRLLWNIAVVEKDLWQYHKAAISLRRYLQEAGSLLSNEEQQDARDLLEVVQNFIANVTFEVEPAGATISADGEVLGRAPLVGPVPLSLGTREILVEKGGFTTFRARVGLMGSETVKATLAPASR